jgi:hypothetical protein
MLGGFIELCAFVWICHVFNLEDVVKGILEGFSSMEGKLSTRL